MALERTIYIGPFIHSESLTELDICVNGMIGVNEDGKIAFIRRDSKGRQLPIEEGWEQAKVVRTQDYGFFFPGFIGMLYSFHQAETKALTIGRHAYSCFTISERRHFRKVHPPGLAQHLHFPT